MGVASYGGRHPVWRAVACLVVLLGASLMLSAPALAVSQRGHVFSFSFGSFANPAGVAVSGASGDVYVSDLEHKRVQVFVPVIEDERLVTDTFAKEIKVSTPGAIAIDNSTEGADPSSGDVYVVSGGHVIEKFGPEGKALGSIKAFEEKGTKKSKKLAGVADIAVDSSGNLFVYQAGGQIYTFNDATSNESVSALRAPVKEGKSPRPALAVNSNDDLYVGLSEDWHEHSLQELLLREVEEEDVQGQLATGELTEAAASTFSVIAKLDSSADTVLTPALDYEPAMAVAVNPLDVPSDGVDERDDVYVVNLAGFGVDKTSTIAQFGPEEGEHETAKLIQRFGTSGLTEANAIAVDPQTGAVYVTDRASGKVDVFGLESIGAPTVEGLSAESSPTQGGAWTLSAQVDPTGLATEYSFEYGTSSCATSSCTSTESAELPVGFGGQSVAAQLPSLPAGVYYYRVLAKNSRGQVHSVEQTFTVVTSLGLLPDDRRWEMVSPAKKGGAEPEAIRNEGGLIEASANGDAITYAADGPMPAGAEPEGNRNPEPTQVLSVRDSEAGHEAWLSQDITTPNESGAGPAPGERWEYQAFSTDLALSLVDPFPGARGRLAQPPLSPLQPGEEAGKQENTIYLRDEAQLQPEAGEASVYVAAKANGVTMGNAGYFALITKSSELGPGFGRELAGEHTGIVPEGTTPDLSDVVFRSENVSPGLYEETDGAKPQLVSILENGEKATERENGGHDEVYLGGAIEGKEPANVRHAVSENGSRVVWTYDDRETNIVHLEMRESGETAEPQTVQLDAEDGGSGAGVPDAVFQTANAEGSKVFFTDEQRLTPDSGATKGNGIHEGRADLYVAEVGIVGGHLKITALTDLTALRDEGADLLVLHNGEGSEGGGVIGASEDGSYVYFAANGALAPGATRGHCPSLHQEGGPTDPRPPGTTCNLYMRHYDAETEAWEPTKLVAVLSSEDAPDWGSFLGGDLAYMTSRVSPNGRYLAFMSDRSLTGYDNEDVSSKSPGERLDEEVYLYSAGNEHEPHPGNESEPESLACASCNPTGARPTGLLDIGRTFDGAGEGLGLVVDRSEVWSELEDQTKGEGTGGRDNWLSGSVPGWTTLSRQDAPYQSRYLSNEGRLFFNSADALVPLKKPFRSETVDGQPQDVGVENVYEYQPNKLGACNSSGGCVALISSGESEHESAFLDASETGNDVFFLTEQQLVSGDKDNNYDVYDARSCETGSCTEPVTEEAHEPCTGEACQGAYIPGVTSEASGTSIFSGPGNLVVPKHEVLPAKTVTPPAKKTLTRSQKLAKALKACRTKYKKTKAKRVSCEKQARKKFGPIKKTASKK